MLFTKLKFSPNTVILWLATLRFFYIHVLKRGRSIAETPYPNKVCTFQVYSVRKKSHGRLKPRIHPFIASC
jgi:hypothetical protein